MSIDYDIHSYPTLPDSMLGSGVDWLQPKWWMPLGSAAVPLPGSLPVPHSPGSTGGIRNNADTQQGQPGKAEVSSLGNDTGSKCDTRRETHDAQGDTVNMGSDTVNGTGGEADNVKDKTDNASKGTDKLPGEDGDILDDNGNKASPSSGHGLMAALAKLFHRHQRARKSSKRTAAVSSHNQTSGTSSPPPPDVTNHNVCETESEVPASETDFERALATLFDDASCLSECPILSREEHPTPAFDRLMEHLDDDLSECSFPGGKTPPEKDPEDWSLGELGDRIRKVKFADDEGLPLTAVIIFERSCESSEEEEDNEEGTRRKKRASLKSYRKQRLMALCRANKEGNGLSCTRPAVVEGRPNFNNYRKYYKPYNEDYEYRRIQVTGAFSMVGY